MTPQGHRRLILTRHAKSDWDNAALPDHQRPLNGRGKAAAAELGQWLASRDYLPDEVLSSDATRTRETWEGVAKGLTDAPAPAWDRKLYEAEPEGLMAALKAAKGRTVMMIGHNPGIAEFAAMLPAHPPATADFARYPTSATLVVDFESDGWIEIEAGRGSVLDFFLPGERGG